MNQYEVMYVLDTGLEDQARIDAIARFAGIVTQNGGVIDRIDEWGKRRLAYTINYKTDGYYILMYITAPPSLPKELERNLQISEAVLRYLVVRFEGALPPKREPLRPAASAPEAASEADAPAEEGTEPVEAPVAAEDAVTEEAPAEETAPAVEEVAAEPEATPLEETTTDEGLTEKEEAVTETEEAPEA